MLTKYNNRIGSPITRCNRAMSRAMSFGTTTSVVLIRFCHFCIKWLGNLLKETRIGSTYIRYPIIYTFCYAPINYNISKNILCTSM